MLGSTPSASAAPAPSFPTSQTAPFHSAAFSDGVTYGTFGNASISVGAQPDFLVRAGTGTLGSVKAVANSCQGSCTTTLTYSIQETLTYNVPAVANTTNLSFFWSMAGTYHWTFHAGNCSKSINHLYSCDRKFDLSVGSPWGYLVDRTARHTYTPQHWGVYPDYRVSIKEKTDCDGGNCTFHGVPTASGGRVFNDTWGESYAIPAMNPRHTYVAEFNVYLLISFELRGHQTQLTGASAEAQLTTSRPGLGIVLHSITWS